MLGLALGVAFAHRRARQPIARLQLVKQPLALQDTQLDLVTPVQTLSQCLAIPQVGWQTDLCRLFADQRTDFFQLFGR